MIEGVSAADVVARAVGYVRLDFAGVVAALIAAGVAWSGMRQFSTLVRAYIFAANELAIVRDSLESATTERS